MTTTFGHWETIRPWIDRISLQVKELTSVSATFVLTSAVASVDEVADEEIATNTARDTHTDDKLTSTSTSVSIPTSTSTSTSSSNINSTFPSRKSVGEILARGFTIKVNGSLWKNYFLSLNDEGSEAVIILHGLRPARPYEVELIVEQEEKPLIRRDFSTLDSEAAGHSSEERREEPEENSEESANASFNTASSPLSGPSRELTPPMTPDSSSPPNTNTIEDQVAQYQQTMLSISQEHESLIAQLKMARKESQRVENSARSEVEALKKSAEKQSIPDQRARQKVLALQEAVKQTQFATGDLEAQTKRIQEELPRLRQEEAAVEAEHRAMKEIANKKSAEAENAIRADKKRMSELQSEVTVLSNRIDKLTTKRDKVANDTVPDLEQQLAEIRREIGAVEMEKEQLARFQFVEEPMPSPTGYRNPLRQIPPQLQPQLQQLQGQIPPQLQSQSQLQAQVQAQIQAQGPPKPQQPPPLQGQPLPMSWHAPRRSGQFPQGFSSLNGPINPSINPSINATMAAPININASINAAAPSFYPSRPPPPGAGSGVGPNGAHTNHRIPGQPMATSTSARPVNVNEFRPFDTPLNGAGPMHRTSN